MTVQRFRISHRRAIAATTLVLTSAGATFALGAAPSAGADASVQVPTSDAPHGVSPTNSDAPLSVSPTNSDAPQTVSPTNSDAPLSVSPTNSDAPARGIPQLIILIGSF